MKEWNEKEETEMYKKFMECGNDEKEVKKDETAEKTNKRAKAGYKQM